MLANYTFTAAARFRFFMSERKFFFDGIDQVVQSLCNVKFATGRAAAGANCTYAWSEKGPGAAFGRNQNLPATLRFP